MRTLYTTGCRCNDDAGIVFEAAATCQQVANCFATTCLNASPDTPVVCLECNLGWRWMDRHSACVECRIGECFCAGPAHRCLCRCCRCPREPLVLSHTHICSPRHSWTGKCIPGESYGDYEGQCLNGELIEPEERRREGLSAPPPANHTHTSMRARRIVRRSRDSLLLQTIAANVMPGTSYEMKCACSSVAAAQSTAQWRRCLSGRGSTSARVMQDTTWRQRPRGT